MIDKAMADVRDYNAEHPDKPLAVRLRVWGGFMAPAWAMKLGGPPIEALHKNKHRRVGRFWSPEYRQAWAAAAGKARRQVRLLAAYPRGLDDLVHVLHGRAVLLPRARTRCRSRSAPRASPRRPTRSACSNGSTTTPPGSRRASCSRSTRCARGRTREPGDPEFTEGIMRDCRKTLGVRCVFDNHNLDTDLPQPLVPLYALMKKLGPGDRVPDRRDQPAGLRGHDQDGRGPGRDLDRAVAGLPAAFPSAQTRSSSTGRR